MKNITIKDIHSIDFTNYLKELSQLAPVNEEERKQLVSSISTLKTIKESMRRAFTPEEREHINNWSYLLFTIDLLKDTLKNYEIISQKNYRLITYQNYVKGHQLSRDKAMELFNQYTLR